jgi:hypothetical protein
MNGLSNKFRWWARELIAFCIWSLLIIKVGFYDLDIALVVRLPRLWPVLKYRALIFLPFIVFILVLLKKKRTRRFLLYVGGYPVVLLFARLVWPALKHWPTLVVFAPGIYSLFLSLKWRLILTSLAVFGAASVILLSQPLVLELSIAVLLCFLMVHFILRIWFAFSPSSLFTNMAPIIDRMWQETIERFSTKDLLTMRQLDPGSDDYRKQHTKNLKELYTFNLMWTYVAKRLRAVITSHQMDLYFITAVFYTSVLTITVFAFCYLALFKIDANSFVATSDASLWTFLLFSFNVILRAGFATVAPRSTSATVLTSGELLAGVFIAFIVVSVLLKHNRERYKKEIESTIVSLREGADRIADFILAEFRMSMAEAKVQLAEDDPGFRGLVESFDEER